MKKIIKILNLFFVLHITVLIFAPSYFAQNKDFQYKKYDELLRQIKGNEKYEVDWGENAEIYVHPVYGVLVYSKDRWKNWVFRGLIIIMVYISLVLVLITLPKNSDFNFIVCYILGGSLFVLSFWETLCGWFLTNINSYKSGLSFILISLPMYVGSYLSLMRLKKQDISYAQIKEEIRKMNAEKLEAIKNMGDPRLNAISGIYGEWEDEDFIRVK